MSKRTSVLIVDDSALIRSIFREMLASDPEIEVLGAAEDPFVAREKIKQLNPDVITLDIEMPKMDGLSFLEKIMTLRPMPVIMVSTLTQKGADETLRALEIGAVDYISKPTGPNAEHALAQLKEELVAKVKAAGTAKVRPYRPQAEAPAKPPLRYNGPANLIIAIGSSTGGIEALREVLTVLPANIPPIVITQHLPPVFTDSFAQRLNKLCQPRVQEAKHMQKIEPGNIYIAPGSHHLEIAPHTGGGYHCHLHDGPPVSSHKPSVDVLFDSVAKHAGANAVGAILTGMGKDGAQGMLKMKKAGAPTIGQNEATCIVYGMPKVAKQLGGVDKELPLNDIASELLTLSSGKQFRASPKTGS